MEDISKSTIAVLLILVVLISVIGTWVVLSTLINVTTEPQQTQTQTNLKLTVQKPQSHKSISSQGNIQLTVLRLGEKGEV